MKRRSALSLCGVLAFVVFPAGAADQEAAGGYPAKPLRLLVGQGAGGGIDIIARALAQQLTATLGQSVIVDNRAGAAGIIASDLVAKAAPDGYTALLVSATYSISPSLYKSLPFDPKKDLQPVTMLGSSPFILLAHPTVPAKNTRELIAAAKAKPRQFNFGSGGLGSTGHLSAELFASMAGIELTHIPYKGTGPAMVDMLSGQLQLLFNSITQALPYAKSGRLTAIGLTSAQRSAVMPELPTIAESGLPGYDFSTWYGVMIPSGTAKSILGRLHAEILKALHQPDFRERLHKDGIDPVGNTPEQFAALVRSEIEKWARVIKATGIKQE